MKILNSIYGRIRALLDSRREPESARLIADVFWRTVLVCALIVLAASIAYGAWDLTGVLDQLSQSPQGTMVPAPSVNRGKLDALVQNFDAREAQFNTLESSAQPAVSDPSKASD